MSPNHTPGPWLISVIYTRGPDGPPHPAVLQVECDEGSIASIVVARPEAEANARLIASSPILLDALLAAFAYIDHGSPDDRQRVLALIEYAVNMAVADSSELYRD